jgi:signal transduction histidine kinase
VAIRTAKLAANRSQLQWGVVWRTFMKDAVKKNGTQHDERLEKSLRLQTQLRQMTHRAFAAQESERKKISCELQNEIAQTLLGINVRLLSLKRQARGNAKGLKKEIASTQRLVLKSAQSVRKLARELDIHQPV